jgi:hypothetical protein
MQEAFERFELVIEYGHVSGLFMRLSHEPRAGIAMRRSGANQCRELKGSPRKSGFPNPNLVDHMVVTVLRPPHIMPTQQIPRLRGRNGKIFLTRHHCPD